MERGTPSGGSALKLFLLGFAVTYAAITRREQLRGLYNDRVVLPRQRREHLAGGVDAYLRFLNTLPVKGGDA